MSAAVQRCEKLAFGLGWKHPFFLPIKARCSITEDASIPTAGINVKGQIKVNPKFIATLGDDQVKWLVAHELCHYVLLTDARRQGRDFFLWNVASDMAINHFLQLARVGQGIEGAFYPPQGMENAPAEELYEWIVKNAPPQKGQPMPGQGCGVDPAEGTEGQGDESDAEGQEKAAVEAQAHQRARREAAAQAKFHARNDTSAAGQMAGDALARLLEIPPSKVGWAQLLRGTLSRALACHGRDDVSFTRANRRTGVNGPIFPGDVSYKARCAVVIDTSGSVSDKDLEIATSETLAVSTALGVKVYLVTHDHKVQWKGWLAPSCRPARIQDSLRGRGGTDFAEAYDAVGEAGRFDYLVHLTDGEVGHWPELPAGTRKLVVALLGNGHPHVPANARVVETERPDAL